jgi:hypothetical protein
LTHGLQEVKGEPSNGSKREADARTRTGDPFITSEVLYQLSYVGRGNPV